MSKATELLAKELAHLSVLKKLVHPKVKKKIVGAACGASVAVVGAALAQNGEYFVGAHCHWLTHAAWDAFGYTIHAVGSIPLLWYGEKLWVIFKPDGE